MAAFGIAVTLFACKGDTGPAGPAGTNGVANISSNIYTVSPGSWSNPSAGLYNYVASDASITNANTDGIEVFMSGNNTNWFGLPLTNVFANPDELFFMYINGQITFEYDGSSAPATTQYFKVVVIPPAVMKQHPRTNWKNWSEVSAIIQAQKMMNNQ
ncbi:MAG: hypothetical protein HKL88_08925 [Bacteroidia bacterium]|nr:hypothetical protein [Bacteroidia bacterium]